MMTKSIFNRDLFPILNQEVNDEKLIYLDNAATSQVPQSVIEAMSSHYHLDHANIHRGVHTLAQRSTEAYEQARHTISSFVHCKPQEVIFTRGTTEGMNLLIQSGLEDKLHEGDIVLTSRLEHHSTLVPLQEVCRRQKAHLSFVDLNSAFQWQLDDWIQQHPDDLDKVKAVVIGHVSNVLGVEQDIETISKWAKKHHILVFVDGAQAIPHMAVDLEKLSVDGYCFSSHKMHGPTGIGVCYIREEFGKTMHPLFFGGEMIHQVGDYQSDFKEMPWKFEAGTMPISQVAGLAEATKFMQKVGYDAIEEYIHQLVQYAYKELRNIPGIQCYQDNIENLHGIISFNFEGVHPHDIATAYDLEGIAVRAGHHCAQPLMRYLDVPATVRLSVAGYNTMEEMHEFIQSTYKIKEFFQWA